MSERKMRKGWMCINERESRRYGGLIYATVRSDVSSPSWGWVILGSDVAVEDGMGGWTSEADAQAAADTRLRDIWNAAIDGLPPTDMTQQHEAAQLPGPGYRHFMLDGKEHGWWPPNKPPAEIATARKCDGIGHPTTYIRCVFVSQDAHAVHYTEEPCRDC